MCSVLVRGIMDLRCVVCGVRWLVVVFEVEALGLYEKSYTFSEKTAKLTNLYEKSYIISEKGANRAKCV